MKILNDSPAYSVSEGLVLRSPGVYLKEQALNLQVRPINGADPSRTRGSSITYQWKAEREH